jgi:hypothetical protein
LWGFHVELAFSQLWVGLCPFPLFVGSEGFGSGR